MVHPSLVIVFWHYIPCMFKRQGIKVKKSKDANFFEKMKIWC